MLSDEEREAINHLTEKMKYHKDNPLGTYVWLTLDEHYVRTILNLIEKQSKEIEELKDDRKKYAEEYIHNNPWLYKQLNENYILRVESEQKERKAWIKGTNDAHKLCNKKWKDKIKAKIEEVDKDENASIPDFIEYAKEYAHEKLQSLLEKE